MRKGLNPVYINKIRNYYEESQWLYQLFCADPETLGMHFGFWDKNVKTRKEAIANQNQAIINFGKIISKDVCLEAGCGQGGTAIYIAKKTGACVYGITLSPTQVKLAKKYSQVKGVSENTNFNLMDYTNTTFKNNSFDVIYGNESICYASPKSTFLKEAKRILKPGGKLIITDGYLARTPINAYERKIVRDFVKNFALKELICASAMTKQINKAGFINIKVVNKIEAVKPSVKYFHKLAKFAKPFGKFLSFLPISYFKAIDKNATSLISAGEAIEINLAAYYLHYAEKPKK